MRSIVSILYCGAVIVSTTAAAKRFAGTFNENLPLVGSSGGTGFTRMCPTGYVLTGFNFRTGLVVDAIGIRCRQVFSSGNLGPEASYGLMAGGNGGTAGSASCENEATNPSVIAAQTGGSAGFGIAAYGGTCKEWFAASKTWGQATRYVAAVRQGTVFMSSATCSDGATPAIGIWGRQGSIVDAFGLVCGQP